MILESFEATHGMKIQGRNGNSIIMKINSIDSYVVAGFGSLRFLVC